jgi:hypothetical protein
MDNVRERLEDLIRNIGLGFHPDTRVSQYFPALPYPIGERYEAVLDEAWAAGLDVYAIGAEMFEHLLAKIED